MKLYKLSLRNLRRNPRRTLLNISIISFGVAGFLIFSGYVDYSMWGLREITIKKGLGHIQVFHKDYNYKEKNIDFKHIIKNYQKIYKKLIKLPYIEAIYPELELYALISSGEKTVTGFLKAYGLNELQEKINLGYNLVKGKNLVYQDKYLALVGEGLAKKLNIKLNDYITVLTNTVDGSINAIDFKVKGIISTGIKDYDAITIITPLEPAMEIVDVKGIQRLIIFLENSKYVDLAYKEIQSAITNYPLKAIRWEELATEYHKIKKLYENFLRITGSIIIVIIIFAIANSITTTILERIKEFATIRVLGATKFMVLKILFFEILALGIIGGILGILFGILIGEIINITGGIYISPPPGHTKGYVALIKPNHIRLIEAFFIAIISNIFGGIIPIGKLLKLEIADGLRHI